MAMILQEAVTPPLPVAATDMAMILQEAVTPPLPVAATYMAKAAYDPDSKTIKERYIQYDV